MDAQDNITQLLHKAHAGDGQALDALLPQIYQRLRELARRQLGRESGAHTLSATALVHETFLNLLGEGRLQFSDREHFFAYAVTAMRHALIDRARRNTTRRRHAALHVDDDISADGALELAALEQAFARLAALDPRLARIADLRLAAGLSSTEIGNLLGVTDRTVEREWNKARAFLSACLGSGDHVQ
ncbi:MAG: ECF-type sigma factor [Tahibacter sp.]